MISQQLFHRGQELDDNSRALASLEIFPNEIFTMRKLDEDAIVIDSDLDEPVKTKKKREEGDAFKGTLLSGNSDEAELDAEGKQKDEDDWNSHLFYPTMKECPACHFENDEKNVTCCSCDEAFT